MALFGDIPQQLGCSGLYMYHEPITPVLGLFEEVEWHVKQQVDVHRSGYAFFKNPNGNKRSPATPQFLGKVTDKAVAKLLGKGVVHVASWFDRDE